MRAAESGAARSFLFSFPRPPTLLRSTFLLLYLPSFSLSFAPPSRSPPSLGTPLTFSFSPSFHLFHPFLCSLSLSRADLGVPEFSRSPFIPIFLFLSKLFLLSRGSLLPSASPASSIGVSRNWRDMLSRSFVLWSTRRRNGACRRWTLSLSLSPHYVLRPRGLSAMLPLSKVAAVSLHLELWISKDRSHYFLTDTVKREGNGKTWRVNSVLLGIKLLRLRSISNGGSPDFPLLLPSLRHFCIFMTISRLIETSTRTFSSSSLSILSRSLPGAFVLHRNAYCLVVSTRRYFHPSILAFVEFESS